MITEFQFQTDLVLRRLREGSGKLFYVDADFAVTFKLNGSDMAVVVPKGMDTDLASIPEIVPAWMARKLDTHLEASVVHDWLYTRAGQLAFPHGRRVADDVFKAAMDASGVNPMTRDLMYTAVRIGGGPIYDKGRDPYG